ncbi:MAG: ABC transporter ATP-binding protein [Planctomycetota bacterium]
MEYLTLEGISKKYAKNVLFEDLNFQVHQGEFLVLLGPSGCGKSSILRLIAGLESVDRGTISLAGQNITQLPSAKRNIAMVFQNYALYPHMTVRQNLCFPLKMAKISGEEQSKRLQDVAQILELTELLERKPGQLSGGQMQRVAVGRAIIRKPALFLLDEPLSNLDAKLRQQLRMEFKNLHQRLGITTLYVTHDQVEAMTLGQRILLIHQGKIQQCGTPLELYHQPANTFVASFLGHPPINLVSKKWITSEKVAELPENGTVGIRPEHLKRAEKLEKPLFSGKVLLVELLGSETLVTCGVGEEKVIFKQFSGEPPHTGEIIPLALVSDCLLGFNEKGQRIF